MRTFDADAWLDAHQPWALKVGGRVYRSQPVSVLAVVEYEAAIKEAAGDGRKVDRALERLFRLAFPWRWRYLRRDPVVLILLLDDAARAAVVRDFFASVAQRFQRSIPTTPGNDSLAPTPPPTIGQEVAATSV